MTAYLVAALSSFCTAMVIVTENGQCCGKTVAWIVHRWWGAPCKWHIRWSVSGMLLFLDAVSRIVSPWAGLYLDFLTTHEGWASPKPTSSMSLTVGSVPQVNWAWLCQHRVRAFWANEKHTHDQNVQGDIERPGLYASPKNASQNTNIQHGTQEASQNIGHNSQRAKHYLLPVVQVQICALT